MTPLLVDTDVVSFLFKRSRLSERYRALADEHLLAISFMTLAELQRWPFERGWALARRLDLDAHLKRYPVLFATTELCIEWASIKSGARRTGRPIDTADAWIAATARLYRVPLLTNNAKDFAGVDGLRVITA